MGKSAPKPPDPRQTAAAQTGTNVGTAISNAMLGNVNQITPEGTLNYSQSGTYKWMDPYTKKSYDIPTFTMEQALSPENQELWNIGKGTELNLANLAKTQSGKLGELLSSPIDLSNEAVEGRLMELGRKRLDPLLARRRADVESDVINRGIRPGSDAYAQSAMRTGELENDAYNELLLKGRGQSVQEILTTRNQPINEITALMSGSQVSQPNFLPSDQPDIPTTDVAGIIGDTYQAKLDAWKSKNAMTASVLGGLFGGVGNMFAGRFA